MNELLLLSGVELARKIRDREVTSADVVEAHIERVRKVNPILNAVVRERFDTARREAAEADRKTVETPAGELPPFHGVPCTIKECFALEGMPNASGLVARKDLISQQDATAVARLRKAGAIPLGVTNTSELCMWMESNNKVYGRTNNPYDPSRIVGGSSGGEGAIVAAAGSPFGLGSDIGGSIRMPAFFNGVFGHKPTGGLVPGTGQFPFAVNEARRYLTTGPLAKKAEDLWPLLQVLAGPDGKDDGCMEFDLGDPDEVEIGDLTVLSVEGNGAVRVSVDLVQAQQKAAEALEARGAQVKTARIERLRHSLNIWSSMLSAAGGPSFSELLGQGTEIGAFAELLKFPFGKSPFTFPAIVLAIIEKAPKLAPERAKRFVDMGKRLREELVDMIGPSGILLYPSYATPAPKHNKPLLPPFNWIYTAVLNVMELPFTQVPLVLNHQGLPLGVQVAALHGNDHVTIAVAKALQDAFGGWVEPPLLGNL